MKYRPSSFGRLLLPAAALLSFFASAPICLAGNTWTGGGAAPFNWSDVNNWGGAAPLYGTLTFAGSLGTTNTVDASTSQSQLLWTGTSAWTLNNSNSAVISLFDNGGVQAKLENQSTGLVTINAPITFAATAGVAWGEINAVSGDMTFGTVGTLTVNGTGVAGIRMFAGSGKTTTFNNTVSASDKYFATVGSDQTVVIGGSFTSGNFYLMNGSTLKLNTGGSLTTSGTGFPALRLGGDFGTTGSQNLTAGATFQLTPLTGGLTSTALINTVSGNTSGALLIDSLNTSGTNTLAGDFYLDSALRVNQAAGGTITISDATTDIKAQTLTLTGGGTINLTGVVQNSIAGGSLVVGVNGIAGGPTLNLSQANTYTGDTFVRAGTLAFASGGSANSSTIRLGSSSGTGVDATINLTSASGGQTISSTINPVTTTGTGTLTLNSQNTSGTNTYSGHIGMDRNFTINQSLGGTLAITQVHPTADTGNLLGTDIKGFTLTLGGAGTITISGATGTSSNIYGTGSLIYNGTGTLNLNGTNTYAGGTTIRSGTVSLGNITGAGTGAITLGDTTGSSNSTLQTTFSSGTATNAITVAAGNSGIATIQANAGGSADVLSGAVTLNKSLTLKTLSTGTLRLSGAITGGTGTNTITNAGTGTGGVTLDTGVIGNGTGTVAITQNSSTSALTLGGANTFTGGVSVLAGTLNLANSNGAGGSTSVITASGGTTLNVTNSTTFVVNGVTVSGTNANVTLTSANATGGFSNAFTGTSDQTLTIGGTVAVNFAASTQQLSGFAGTVNILDGATLAFRNSSLNNGGSSTLFNLASTSFLNTRNGGAVALGGLTGSGSVGMGTSGSNGIGLTYTIGARNDASNTFSGVIQNGDTVNNKLVSITKAGTGIQIFSGANTYSGATTVNAGTLRAGIASVAGVSGAFGLNSAVTTANTAGAILDLNGFNTQIGSLAVGGATGGNVTLGSATLSTGGNNTSTSYAGVISGTGGLIKFGTGNQTLTNINTYTGGTTVKDAGTLTLARVNNLNDGSGAIRGTLTVNTGATVVTSQQNQLGYSAGIETTTLNINGGTFNNTFAGDQGWGTTVNLTGGTLTTNGGVSSNTATSLFVLGKNAGGTTGVNTFASATTSTIAGRLQLDAPSYPTAIFTVADGAAATDLLVSAAITQRTSSAGITKAGLGTMTLSGANTYTGLTTVSAGFLELNKTAVGGNAIASNVSAGGNDKVTDILVNGGALNWLASDQVIDSGSINVTSGRVNFGSANETIYDFNNSGGTVNYGTGTVTIIDPTWSGGTNEIHGNTTFGVLNISGGTNTVFGAAGPNGGPGTLTVGSTGGLNFSGTASPDITANSDAGTAGKLVLAGNVSSTVTAGTASITSGGTAINPGQLDLGASPRTFSVDNGSAATDLIVSTQVIGTGALAKAGSGSLALTATNTYTGETSISGGTLELPATGSVASLSVVISGGTLLLGGGTVDTGDRLNNSGSVSLGNAASDSILQLSNTVSETAGPLSLSAGGAGRRVIDFGSASGILNFTSLLTNASALQVWNWSGNVGTGQGTDQFIVNSFIGNSTDSFSNVVFFSDSGITSLGTAAFSTGNPGELVPVPEPGALFGGLALLAPLAWRERRQWMRCREARRPIAG